MTRFFYRCNYDRTSDQTSHSTESVAVTCANGSAGLTVGVVGRRAACRMSITHNRTYFVLQQRNMLKDIKTVEMAILVSPTWCLARNHGL